MSAADSLRRQRRLRIGEIAILILGVADAILNAGSFMVILPVLLVALMAWSLRVNVRTVRLIQRTHRPRPDYAAIAGMEREVWGETFRHEGAPVFTLTTGAGGVSMSALGEYGPARRRECIGCGYSDVRVGGKFSHCYEQAKRGHRRSDAILIRSGAIVSPGASITLPSGETIGSEEWARRGGRTA